MLFSDDDVAQFINNNFEPAWESVRPVPMVTIDFGNGEVVQRTLHGNVATYATSADGTVLDVLPGIYEPKTYVKRLEEFVQLHEYVHSSQIRPRFAQNSVEFRLEHPRKGLLRHYHKTQGAALKEGKPRFVFEKEVERISSILAVETSVKIVLKPAERIRTRAAVARGEFPASNALPSVNSTDDLPAWKALAADTATNETIRRLAIHKYLQAQDEGVTPQEMKKWLYREVLHADLDDPYLGLGKILFDTYPFAEEDRD